MSRVHYSIGFFSLTSVLCLLLLAVSGLNTLAGRYAPRQPMLPQKYTKNPHTAQKITEDAEKYIYQYTFKDHQNATSVWAWEIDKRLVDQAANRYGLPPAIFSPYEATPEVIATREQQIEKGMFKYEGKYLVPDIQTLVNYYLPLMRPLYRLLDAVADQADMGQRERLHLLMRFCQDIPYGVPPNMYDGKVIAGLFTPPLILNNGWGDCDSKCVLFSSILLHDPAYDLVFIQSPGHTSLGVKGVPRPYEKSITYKGESYIFCEPVGPRRSDLGVPQNDYVQVTTVAEVRPWPAALERARQVDAFTEFSFQSAGSNLKILMAQNGKVINSQQFKLFQNSNGFDKPFYKVANMPDEKGFYHINTDGDRLYLMLKRPGYYIFKSLANVSKHNNKQIVFNFDPDKCLYITTRPNQSVYIFKKEANGYSGKKCQADAGGVIRIICDPGLYDISSTTTLSGDLFKIDYFAGIGAAVKT